MKEVLQYIPVSASTFNNGVKAGKYPKPIKISARLNGWKVEDIKAFIEQQQ